MSEPFLGEIRMMSFSVVPLGWALCNGQLLPISQNVSLFQLLGTTYGGDGQNNFALPNLQGRVPIHRGGTHILGEQGGEFTHTLTLQEMTAHSHTVRASALDGDQPTPANNVLAGTATAQLYASSAFDLAPLAAGTLSTVGGGQAHDNTQPYLVINFCIALQGIVPTAT